MSTTSNVQPGLLRTLFWTFLLLTLVFTCYGFAAEVHGHGFILTGETSVKPWSSIEVQLAWILSLVTVIPLSAISFFSFDRRPLWVWLGTSVSAFWLFNTLLPRF